MNLCAFCKNPEPSKGHCPNCGSLLFNVSAAIVYGKSFDDRCSCDLTVTDKYLIILAIPSAKNASREAKKKKSFFGFYDLREIRKIVYPYYTPSFRKPVAFKIVHLDGSDLIVWVNASGLRNVKTARDFVGYFGKAGVTVEDGSREYHEGAYCEHPFVDAQTLGTRVCASAASFVKLCEEQYTASPIVDASAPSSVPAPEPTPAAIEEPSLEYDPYDSEKTVAITADPLPVHAEPSRTDTGTGTGTSKTDSESFDDERTVAVMPGNSDRPEPPVRPNPSVSSATDPKPAVKPTLRFSRPSGFSRPAGTPSAPAAPKAPASKPRQPAAQAEAPAFEVPAGKKACPCCGIFLDQKAKSCFLCGYAFKNL